MNYKMIALAICFIATILFLPSCGGDPSFSLSSESTGFSQIATQTAKIDILWVVDNSGSMETAQENLGDNFNAFITQFSSTSLDYQIAVAGTDAWRGSEFNSDTSTCPLTDCKYDPDKLHFRDGNNFTNSGVFIINNSTPDLISTFVTNATLGILGASDERAFQSMQGALDDPFNTDFVREDSFLAVIVLSDENDLSHDGRQLFGIEAGTIHEVNAYKDYLDTKTGSSTNNQKYSFSTISILDGDQTCLTAQEAGDPNGQKYGTRYEELVDLTGGSVENKISICSDFATSLQGLADQIIQDALVFDYQINREPIVSTIIVQVNGALIPMSDGTSDGWIYHVPTTGDLAGEHVISFIGGSDVLPSGASISMDFDPASFD